MTASVSPATPSEVQSSLALVNTRLPADSPLLPLCAALASDCQLTASQFANKWDAYRYSHNLKQLDQSSLTSLRQHLMDEHNTKLRRTAAKQDRAASTSLNSRAVRDNGQTKRVYSIDTLSDLLGGELAALLPADSVTVKKETMDEDGLTEEDGWSGEVDSARKAADKEERKDVSDPFVTPSIPRHRPALPQAAASSTSSTTPSSLSSLFPSTPTPFLSTSSSLLFSPVPSTPSTELSAPKSAYTSRTNPSELLLTYNSQLAPATAADVTEYNKSTRPVDIEVLYSVGELQDMEDKRPFRYMYPKAEDIREVMLERMEGMERALTESKAYRETVRKMKEEAGGAKVEGAVATTDTSEEKQEEKEEAKDGTMEVDESADEKHVADKEADVKPSVAALVAEFDGLEMDDIGLSSTSARSQHSLIVLGRIAIDANSDDTRLTVSSVALEGNFTLSRCHRINLRLGALPSYSLFPGQMVLAKGVNAHGTAMVVEEFITSAPPPRLSLSPSAVQQYNAHTAGPLVIVAAAGPFTSGEDMTFAPLADLIARVTELMADVLILQGPFIELTHPHVLSGKVGMQETFDEFWPTLFTALPSHTRVVIQPSTKEALHVPVFPQPPFTFSHPKHVHCVANPTTVRINDVTVGLTTCDVLTHMLSSVSSLTKNIRDKKLVHLATQLVHQQSFYPLFPSPSTDEAVDYTHALRFSMPVRPDLLLLPSALGRYMGVEEGRGEEAEGSVVVNGGVLCRGSSGGTYVVVTVHAKSEDEMARDGEDEGRVRSHLVAQRTRVDCYRI